MKKISTSPFLWTILACHQPQGSPSTSLVKTWNNRIKRLIKIIVNSFHETFGGRIFIFIFSHQEKAPIMYICHINYFKDQYILQINISTHLITQEELCGKNYKSVTICKADNKLKRGYLIQVMHDSRKYLYHPWRKKTLLTAPHYSTPEGRNFF